MGVIARQSIKGALANYAGVVIGFLTTFFVLTDCLSQEEIGLTRVMVDAAMLFSSLAQLGSNSSVIRFFPYFKDEDKNHGIFGWSVLLPGIGFLIIGLLFLILRESIVAVYAQKSSLVADYFYLVPMLAFFALYTTVFETNASVLLRITVPKLVREVGIRLFNLAAYLLYGHGVVSLDVFVWMFCGSYGLAMLLDLIYLISLGHVSFRIDWHFIDRRTLKEILRYSLFMTATALAANVPLFNSLFLGAKQGLALTGVYTIAFYIANIVETPYRSLGAISRPVIATAVKEGDWREVNRLGQQVSLHQLLVSSLLFYVIWINLDALFAVIPHGSEYAGGITVVFFLGMGKIINSSYSIAADVLNYSRYYAWSLLFIALLTVSALVLNNKMIDAWSINGSACATLSSYLIYYGVLLWFVWRRLGVSLFGRGQLKIVVMIAMLMGLNWGWDQTLAPLLRGDGALLRILLDALVRTLVLGGLAAVVTYRWKISPTVNRMAEEGLRKIIRK